MLASTRELDVRSLPPPQRHSEIFRTFNALDLGEALVLVNDHDSKPLLYQFQVEHPGGFEWSVLEAGSERFRIEIRRRTAEGSRNVTEYLEEDHRRLDAILLDADRLAVSGSFAEASKRFAEFACGLNRHIDAEENVLFPTLEKLTGMVTGPTTVMRVEHIEIRRWMGAVAAALETRDVAGFKEAVNGLTGILSSHNMKEEQMLYPMADQVVGGKRERDDLVRQIRAFQVSGKSPR